MRRRIKKNTKIFKFLFIIPIIVIVFALGIFSKTLSINVLKININHADCVEEKSLEFFSKLKGQNILMVNLSKTEQALKNHFYCIRKIDFSKKYPNQINIDVLGRVPKIIFASVVGESTSSSQLSGLIEDASMSARVVNSASKFYLTDEEGVIFSNQMDSGIPTVYLFNKDFVMGKSLDQGLIQKISKIIQVANNLGMQPFLLFMQNDQIYLQGGRKILFDLDSDLNIQIASLQLILEKAKIDNVNIEFIDLRFDKPIVRYAPKKS